MSFRGESVSIRCSLINRTPHMLESVVILPASDDYKFIQVETYGYVTSYAPRLTTGDHHHFVWLRGESEMAILLPIAPQLELGELTVVIELSTQITQVFQEVTINIAPEGSIFNVHTSVLLDLTNRANVLRFMNIIVDETPIIPYQVYRRYVSGSARAHVTISGDVVGPIFPGGDAVSLRGMFKNSNHGFYGFAGANGVFNLGLNTWQLHYLRLTNKWTDNTATVKTAFEVMNIEHISIMKR